MKLDIEKSYENIKKFIIPTPCVYSHWLSSFTQAKVYLKLENFNKTGSFKDRGVINFLLSNKEKNITHVTAASAGNHAQAVAFFAQKLGINATIFMPVLTPNNKIFQTKRYQAQVCLQGENYDESFIHAQKFAAEHNAHYIHAYNDLAVISGQGSVALEITACSITPDIIIVPVGGGGLVSGIASYINEKKLPTKTIGVESKNFASMAKALQNHKPFMLDAKKTIAEGIAVRMVGDLTYDICSSLNVDMIDVSDEEIQSSIMFLLERQKIIAEGAGAAAVAGLFKLAAQESLVDKTIVLVISGGNIDLALLNRLSNKELIKTSRLYKFKVIIPDTPGSLSNLLRIVSENRANIVDVCHERVFASLNWNEVLVKLIVEIRDKDHLSILLETLKENSYQVMQNKDNICAYQEL